MRSVIYIDKSGCVSGLADDTLDKLGFLGAKTVERVSEIEFNHDIQKWVAVSLVDREVIAEDVVRSALIAKERDYLNSQIEKSFAAQEA
jgi:hypothetical protein